MINDTIVDADGNVWEVFGDVPKKKNGIPLYEGYGRTILYKKNGKHKMLGPDGKTAYVFDPKTSGWIPVTTHR